VRRRSCLGACIGAAALSAAAVIASATVSAQARLPYGPIAADCDRACLSSLVDRYLAAVVAHDPHRLPLSADVRYTENDQLLPVGDGFWGTASAVGNYRQVFADPVAGQVSFMGSMREGNNPLLMTLRLRVQLGRITEIETTYFRQGGGGPNDIAGLDKAAPEPFWSEAIPAAQRASRYAVATRIHSRRYWLVDEERGVVFAYAIFDMAGTVTNLTLTNGQQVSMANFNRPSSIEVAEAFKIERGLIRAIEMVGGSVPYHFASAWQGGLSGR
jgi:hypothetical protein